jgi:hypothetical protein
MSPKSKCPHCKAEFVKRHGNQVYCTATCKNRQKAMSQARLYGILKDFRKGFISNYNLFLELLPKQGTKTLLLQELEKSGFRHNCYYGAYTDPEKNNWYKVHNYAFSLINKNQILSVIIKYS